MAVDEADFAGTGEVATAFKDSTFDVAFNAEFCEGWEESRPKRIHRRITLFRRTRNHTPRKRNRKRGF